MSQESILVVDDEEVMRDVLGSLLTQAGYEVSLSATAPTASTSPARAPTPPPSST